MKALPDRIGDTGLKFFGRIAASISHELKNVLAIINESAGLMEDVTIMARQGVPIDPLRLQNTAKRIHHQVERADQVIKNMNRFSHSVDRDQSTFDIHDLLASLMALTKRLTDMRGVTVTLAPAERPVLVTTSPFFLKALLWHLLDFAVNKLETCKTMALSVAARQHGIEVRFAPLEGLEPGRVADFPGESETALVNGLGGTLSIGNGDMLLTLPAGNTD